MYYKKSRLRLKIKKQKLVGTPGRTIVQYDRRSNRYVYNGESPLSRYRLVENQSEPTGQLKPNYQFESNTLTDEDKYDENGNYIVPF